MREKQKQNKNQLKKKGKRICQGPYHPHSIWTWWIASRQVLSTKQPERIEDARYPWRILLPVEDAKREV
jgi:hypothetical protein